MTKPTIEDIIEARKMLDAQEVPTPHYVHLINPETGESEILSVTKDSERLHKILAAYD